VLKARNAELPDHRKMEFRIGINLGDVIEEGERIYGDGVNIAARVEGLAEGGGICISGSAYEQIENKLPLDYEYLGEHTVKNIKKPVRIYRAAMEPDAAVAPSKADKPGKKLWQRVALAVVAVLVLGAAVAVFWSYFFRPSQIPGKIAHEKTPAIEVPDKPSIAVLPFTNMSGDPEQEYFSDGITEDIITDLSKVSGLFVIARNSVFTYKGKTVKIKDVGRELGVGYVLEGSVRKAGGRVRITAQLVDANTAGHLWAERYDRDLKDIFALQDEVTQKIVAALALKLTKDEQQRIERKYTDNMEAYDAFLQGLEYFNRPTKEANLRARQMFEKAIDLDSMFAEAYAQQGRTHLMDWSMGWSQDPRSLDEAFELAKKAIALDDLLPSGHAVLADVYLWKKQHDKAVEAFGKAITLDPNDADGLVGMGDILNWSGRPEKAVGLVKKAMRLNPKYPAWYLWALGHAYFLTGQHDQAIETFKRTLNLKPNFLPAHAYLAVIYIEQGRDDEARAEAEKLSKQSPEMSLEAWRKRLPYKDQEVLERMYQSLRKAGME
jgi:adenylate cyclase